MTAAGRAVVALLLAAVAVWLLAATWSPCSTAPDRAGCERSLIP